MDKLRIVGGRPLEGTVRISGAKNAALPLMTASLLTEEALVLENVPQLTDIDTLSQLLQSFGVHISSQETESDRSLKLLASDVVQDRADYDLVRKMRASILVLGPLVARHGHAQVSLPGGCAIGTRPVDYHLKGLEKLGAQIVLEGGYVKATAPDGGLRGADIAFPMISVTGTENLMMAATLARGTTRLINAAKEPEVTDLANCLIKMGAHIQGVGTGTIVIEGVETLGGATHRIIPDRIEAGTYAMAAAITGGDLEITDASLDLLPSVSSFLQEAGVDLMATPTGFRARRSASGLRGVDMITEPFPGFPTDLQAQFMALMMCSEGSSMITETIFENRFMHVAELLRMDASIHVHGLVATVKGGHKLRGAPVMATDLRASACLVLAALAAEGETVISRIYHLDRGYDAMEKKLQRCGALITRVS